MQYDFEELINRPGPLTREEDQYVIDENKRRMLTALSRTC